MEFGLNSSPRILYNHISTPEGLSEWFADSVRLEQGNMVFEWSKSEQVARVLSKKLNDHIRFRWVEQLPDDKAYFELKIVQDELTGELSLLVTDFSEPDEKEDTMDLWETQIADLKRILGA